MTIALSFDANYYLSARPDVFNAFVATAGATGQTWAQFAEAHFNTFGRFEGSNPNSVFNTTAYLTANPDVAAAGVNPFQHFLSFGITEGRAPNASVPGAGAFDSAAYLAANADLGTAGITTAAAAYAHYLEFGQFESRPGTPVVTTPGSSFTLTTAVDAPVATSGSDSFIGVVDLATPANSTLTAADAVNGLAGNDTLRIITQGAGAIADATNGANVSNVETVEIRAVSTGGVALAGTSVPGATLIVNDVSTDALTLTALADVTAIKINGNAVATNGATTAAYVATATSGEVTINGGVTAGAIAVNGAGLTSLAITSSGAANTTGAISTTGTPTAVTLDAKTNLTTTSLAVGTNAAAQSLTITGAGKATLGTLDTDFATVDASGNSGGIVATMSGTATTKITGSSAADTITTAGVLTTGSVDAGAGTDILAVVGADVGTAALGAKYSNFETLQVNDTASVNLDHIAGITAIRIADGGGTTGVTNLTAAQAAAITLVSGGAGAVTIGVKNATDIGQIDTVTIGVNDGAATVGTVALTAPVMTGVEKLVLNAGPDAINVSALTSATSLDSIVLNATHASGTSTVTSGAITPNANTFIDASGSTAATAIDFGGITAAGNAIKIAGGSGADTITTSGVNADFVDGGKGLDSLIITQDAATVEVVTVTSTAILAADADIITGFESAEDKFDFNGVLANGTGVAPGIAAAEVASAATITAALATGDAANDIVFIATTDLVDGAGTQETALDAMIAGFTATNIEAAEAALLATGGALNGVIANLDTVLGATDSVLFQFSTNTDTFIYRITNTDTTVANTLTAAEVELVGAFKGTIDLVAADFA